MIMIIMIIIIIERKNNNNHNNSENDNNNYYYCNESLSADIDNRIHSDNYKTTIITRDQTLR